MFKQFETAVSTWPYIRFLLWKGSKNCNLFSRWKKHTTVYSFNQLQVRKTICYCYPWPFLP